MHYDFLYLQYIQKRSFKIKYLQRSYVLCYLKCSSLKVFPSGSYFILYRKFPGWHPAKFAFYFRDLSLFIVQSTYVINVGVDFRNFAEVYIWYNQWWKIFLSFCNFSYFSGSESPRPGSRASFREKDILWERRDVNLF